MKLGTWNLSLSRFTTSGEPGSLAPWLAEDLPSATIGLFSCWQDGLPASSDALERPPTPQANLLSSR